MRDTTKITRLAPVAYAMIVTLAILPFSAAARAELNQALGTYVQCLERFRPTDGSFVKHTDATEAIAACESKKQAYLSHYDDADRREVADRLKSIEKEYLLTARKMEER